MSATETIITKKRQAEKEIKEPGKFTVIIVNDDVTPVEFVVAMLISIFNHDQTTAFDLTLRIHNTGSAVVGRYTYEIAEQKGLEATSMARSNGYPLVIKIQEE